MTEHEAARTLVKSPPELWAECSDASSLARHLNSFGEIRITRLEPENAVAWEGTLASGTVRLEPSGWGTRVILTARQQGATDGPGAADDEASRCDPAPEAAVEPEASEPGPDAAASPGAVAMPEPVATPEPVRAATPSYHPPPAPQRRGGLLSRLFGVFAGPQAPPRPVARVAVPEPAAVPGPAAVPEPVAPREPVSVATPEPVDVAPPTAAPEPVAPPATPESELDAPAALTAALDSLGQAHHRPFSRG